MSDGKEAGATAKGPTGLRGEVEQRTHTSVPSRYRFRLGMPLWARVVLVAALVGIGVAFTLVILDQYSLTDLKEDGERQILIKSRGPSTIGGANTDRLAAQGKQPTTQKPAAPDRRPVENRMDVATEPPALDVLPQDEQAEPLRAPEPAPTKPPEEMVARIGSTDDPPEDVEDECRQRGGSFAQCLCHSACIKNLQAAVAAASASVGSKRCLRPIEIAGTAYNNCVTSVCGSLALTKETWSHGVSLVEQACGEAREQEGEHSWTERCVALNEQLAHMSPVTIGQCIRYRKMVAKAKTACTRAGQEGPRQSQALAFEEPCCQMHREECAKTREQLTQLVSKLKGSGLQTTGGVPAGCAGAKLEQLKGQARNVCRTGCCEPGDRSRCDALVKMGEQLCKGAAHDAGADGIHAGGASAEAGGVPASEEVADRKDPAETEAAAPTTQPPEEATASSSPPEPGEELPNPGVAPTKKPSEGVEIDLDFDDPVDPL